eukprot:COSAG02_NODE_57069_length_282_cov_0.841530_1_plen_76_part_01
MNEPQISKSVPAKAMQQRQAHGLPAALQKRAPTGHPNCCVPYSCSTPGLTVRKTVSTLQSIQCFEASFLAPSPRAV